MTPEETKRVTAAIDKALRDKVRRGAFALIADCLGSQDVTFLSALGIDANQKLLQIFTEELNKLLCPHKEDADADT